MVRREAELVEAGVGAWKVLRRLAAGKVESEWRREGPEALGGEAARPASEAQHLGPPRQV